MEEFILKTTSGGEKLFLYFPLAIQKQINFPFGTLISINIKKEGKSSFLITKYNSIITLKKDLIKELDLKKGELIKIQCAKILPRKISQSPFVENSIDMLFFIPKISTLGSEFHFEIFKKNEEEYLRIVVIHGRGSSSQIILRRYVDPKLFGSLLGQMQSEGSKTNNESLEFCNKSLYELEDFVSSLTYFGINKKFIFVKLDYHPSLKDKVKDIVNDFQNKIGLKVNYICESSKSRGGYGFKIIARNIAISEIFLNALKQMRTFLVSEKFEGPFKIFCESYLAKILSGDGSFEITSKNRKKFQSRLLIADGKLEYLKHYEILLKKFGFSPKINEKYGYIRSLCNLTLAKRLLEIGAFVNNPNTQRILSFIENNEISFRRNES